jgi:NAD(P)-dependent dehydrogenase (short-subunit alcohol dehydrogenase family)
MRPETSRLDLNKEWLCQRCLQEKSWWLRDGRRALDLLPRSATSPFTAVTFFPSFVTASYKRSRSDRHHRPIDVVFANPGVAKLASFDSVDEEFFDLHFNANVKDGGPIILNGSIADIKGFPAMSVYSATKATVRSFARTWANDLRSRRIRVNVLSPGHSDTPILESLQQGEALTKMKKDGE